MTGWRSVIVEQPTKLSLQDQQLVLTNVVTGEISQIPLDEVARLILSTSSGVLTIRLMQALAKASVSVIICDQQHNPCGETLPIGLHEDAAGRLIDQACWTPERKDSLWAQIVEQKISNQIRALQRCARSVPVLLSDYLHSVEPGDPTNREALAAKVYFRAMFGDSFIRHAHDSKNASLNYGYAILRSAISRALTMHGYHPALGIHHISRNNAVNLSCDLMEPFRPMVDCFVYEQRTRYFDKKYKRDLIQLMQSHCICDGRRMTIDEAAVFFSLRVCKTMTDGREALPEVCLE